MPDSESTNDAPKEWLTTGQLAAHYTVHRDTVRGWILDGIEKPWGRIYLYARRMGGNWKTTPEITEEFFSALEHEEAARAYLVKYPRKNASMPVVETPAAAQRRARKAQERVRKALGKPRKESA